MIKHIVMFKFKGTSEKKTEVAGKFREALLALPGKIEQLKAIEVGINMNPAEKWDLILTATVDNMEDLTAYSNHPLHLAAVEIIKDHKEDRACVDYHG